MTGTYTRMMGDKFEETDAFTIALFSEIVTRGLFVEKREIIVLML